MHTAPDLFMIVIPDKATPTASEAAVDTVSRWGAPVNRFNRAEGGFFWSKLWLRAGKKSSRDEFIRSSVTLDQKAQIF